MVARGKFESVRIILQDVEEDDWGAAGALMATSIRTDA
jgi:phenylpyruvate tautomerase PptA (4-oxalocrotonate tautomerase family)